MTQNTSHAVMAQRVEPHDSLDFFPTPPWATRALCEWLQDNGGGDLRHMIGWDPASGEGHMAMALAEYFNNLWASDIHDYRIGREPFDVPLDFVGDFLLPGTAPTGSVDWIITNPPFRLAQEFFDRAFALAGEGVALLVRTAFLEGGARWTNLYRLHPPSDILIFSERVPMLKGHLDRKASSATSYAWFVWRNGAPRGTQLHWIPPGTRKRLERDEDYA